MQKYISHPPLPLASATPKMQTSSILQLQFLPQTPPSLRRRSSLFSAQRRSLLCRSATTVKTLHNFRVFDCISFSSRADTNEVEGQKQNLKEVKRAYPFHEIEPKWQSYWEENRTFRTPDDDMDTSKPKFYVLDMFPYPRSDAKDDMAMNWQLTGMSSSWSGIVNEIGEEDCSSCTKNEWITPEFPSCCYCGAMVRMWEARKDGTKHPGRRFIGCINYRDRRAYCGFFKWYDPPFPDRAKEVIEDLTLKLKISKEMLDKLKNENSEKTKNWEELAELDSVKTLEKEVKKLKKINAKVQQKKKNLWFL